MHQFTLFELNELVRATLDTHLDPSYWVVAEIGELRINQRGHCYMEFVEKDGEETIAKIRANIWAYTFRNLNPWFESMTGQPLRSGLKVLANVSVQMHEVYGLSLNVRDIDPNFTVGDRAKKRAEILNSLEERSLLNLNRSIQMPLVPQRIAVISSSTAAGYGDFLEQISTNQGNYKFDLRLFNTIMQGEEAVNGIINTLSRINDSQSDFDLIVLIRGGGSQVDFDCFNTLEVGETIAKTSVPVITGIGHERDETIADRVAHTALKTPTAVAEFLIQKAVKFENDLGELRIRLNRIVSRQLEVEQQRFQYLQSTLLSSARLKLMKENQIHANLELALTKSAKTYIEKRTIKLEKYEEKVKLLDPRDILARGYSLSSVNGKLVSKLEHIEKGQKLRTFTDNLEINSIIEDIQDR